ncbi:MAG: LapA family protein [Gammaproteobacteria bacterium]|nr:LapA family protein [Gammaproteobacteria bacterium]
MLRIIRLILLLVIGVSGLVFAALNTGPVTINYYLGLWQGPLALALALAVVLGALLGILACLGGLIKSRYEQRRLRAALQRCEQDAASARKDSLVDIT